ncbi:GNAT family N-acetyltransferase [Rummeliibacillus sp. TYF-LIM-RU47]|uniref:GNAT family N-acetyltransferase n=1 Tax=Rummeliibacillus sp. TYF-LIM-RU47 TaxID=2608406 RepID=UPI00123A0866|nr:GNAT family N-acetyltransferase [Rummeliibacillus sp. TYF-LIM-RU47]
MKLVIRKMSYPDIQEVQEIAQTSWHSTYDGIIPSDVQNRFLAQAYNPDMLEKRYSGSPFYVAEQEGVIVGFANYSNIQSGQWVELAAIYLHPEYQKQGIGTALLQKGIEDLKPAYVCINVEKDNTIGMNFYKAKGFKVIEEFEEDFDGHQLQTVRMKLEVKEGETYEESSVQ